MVGALPNKYDVPWRSDALLQEALSGPSSSDISGGWLTGAIQTLCSSSIANRSYTTILKFALYKRRKTGAESSQDAGGMAGNLKMTMPSAFATAMLAWGLVSFKGGYQQSSGASSHTEQQVQWGADYLLKTLYSPAAGSYYVIYQVQPRHIDYATQGFSASLVGDISSV